jgi:ABC-2 type transport system permease protein
MEGLTGSKRARIAANVALQVLAVSAIVVVINYLSFTRYGRWDLAGTGKLSVSGLTRKVLSSVKKDATVYVYFSPAATIPQAPELYRDIVALLREYEAISKKRLKVVLIDPYRDMTLARDLQERFRVGSRDAALLLEYQGRTKVLPVADLAEYERTASSQEPPEISSFKGEQVVTGALLELISPKVTKIGFLTGHGEPSLGPGSPLKRFVVALKTQNIALEEFDLVRQERVPPEFSSLILFAPRFDLNDREVQALENFWKQQGRLFLAFDPKISRVLLEPFLTSFGVIPDRDLLVAKSGASQRSATLDIDGRFLAETSFLKALSQSHGYFPGGTTSFAVDRRRLAELGISASRALIPAAESYWGETSEIQDYTAVPVHKPEVDLAPPLVFGWALERGSIQDQRVQLRTFSRMLVVGNAGFLRDEALAQANANLDFALLAVNWLSDREQFVAIPPKEQHPYVLRLRPGQLSWLFLVVIVGIPSLAGALGMAAWLTRRQ